MEDIIKESVERYFSNVENIAFIQEEILCRILKQNSDSEYGKKYGFSEIEDVETYQNRVPVVHYAEMKEFYTKLRNGDDPVVCMERVEYYAMTSGSSGEVKYIPQTKSSLETWSHGMIRNGYTPIVNGKNILSGEYLIVTGNDDCGLKNDIRCGYISGIVPKSNPAIDQKNLMREINKQDYTHEEKCNQVTNILKESEITACGGITSHLLNVFSTCQQENHTILDDIQFFLSTGVNIRTVEDGLKRVLSKDVWVANAYTGTEGAFGFSLDSYSDVLYLNYDLYFFEFENMETHEVVGLKDVEVGIAYSLLVTGYNGLYRYSVGDVVSFESVIPPKLKVIGRNSASMNLIGEKYTEQELQVVMATVGKRLGVAMENFIVSGEVVEGKARYQFIIFPKADISAEMKKEFQRVLCEVLFENKALLQRLGNEHFLEPQIIFESAFQLNKVESFFANSKKSGHVKVKTILDLENFQKLSKYMNIDWSE